MNIPFAQNTFSKTGTLSWIFFMQKVAVFHQYFGGIIVKSQNRNFLLEAAVIQNRIILSICMLKPICIKIT